MPDGSILRLDTLHAVVDLTLTHLDGRCHTAIVGACGIGTTTACELVQEALTRRGVPLYPIDCANAGSNFSQFLKAAAKQFTAPRNDGRNVLLIDHAGSLKPSHFALLLKALGKIPLGNLTNFLWIGNLDARGVGPDFQPRIHSVPRSHICFPDLGREELLRIHARIVARVDTRWGESMHHFALDWVRKRPLARSWTGRILLRRVGP